MKKAKLFILFVLAALLCLPLAACEPFAGYEDNAAIAKGNSFSSSLSATTNNAGKYTFSANKCNGIKKLRDITVPENPVFDMTLKVESGRFKVVLVKDGEVFIICESDTEGPVSTTLAAGKYALKLVAEDAKVKLTFNYNSYT